MAKKKGKGKKGSVPAGPPIITTSIIRRERIKVLCPRLGDAFTRAKLVDEILEDVAERILLKASVGKSNTINLSCMRINQLPDLFMLAPDLKSLIDINLSRNNLFNSDHVFEVTEWGHVDLRGLDTILCSVPASVLLVFLPFSYSSIIWCHLMRNFTYLRLH